MKLPIGTEVQDAPPPQFPLKYEEICKLVGHLYIDAHVQRQSITENSKNIIQMLQNEVQSLRKQTADLELELQDTTTKKQVVEHNLEDLLHGQTKRT